jgi:hypothetical protein
VARTHRVVRCAWVRGSLRNACEPTPHFAHKPCAPFTSSEFFWSPLEHGGIFICDAGIVYRFTADFEPEFIVQNLDRTRTCIAYQLGSAGSKERQALPQG